MLAEVEVEAGLVGEPPDPVAPVAPLADRLLDQAVLGQLAQVEGGLVGRDPELRGEVGGAQRPLRGELAEDPVADRVGDRAQDGRVVDGPRSWPRILSAQLLRTTTCARIVAHLCSAHDQLPRPSPATATSPGLWIGEAVSQLGTTPSLFVFPLVGYALTGSAAAGRRSRWRRTPARHRAGAAARRASSPTSSTGAGCCCGQRDRLRAATARSRSPGCSASVTLVHLVVVALGTGAVAGVYMPTEMSAVRSVVTPRGAADRDQPEPGAPPHRVAARRARSAASCTPSRRPLPFLVDAVTFAISFLTVSPGAHRPRPRSTGRAATPVRELGDGLRYLLAPALLPDHCGVLRAAATWSSTRCFFVAVVRLVERGRRRRPRSAWSRRSPGSAASSAPSSRRTSSTGCAPATSPCRSPGCGCRCSSRWSFWSSPLAGRRDALRRPAAQPGRQRRRPVLPGRHHPRSSCRVGSRRRRSSSA